MEGLVTVMCWLFDSEQHLDRNIMNLEEEKHKVEEVVGPLGRIR